MLRRKGNEIINLAGGRPTPGPECLAHPIQVPPERNILGHPAGEIDLRQATAAKLRREQQLVYDPETEVVVTIGAKQSVYTSLLALIDPGGEVLILDPCWVTYDPAIQLAGGVPVSGPVELPTVVADRKGILISSQEAVIVGHKTRRSPPKKGLHTSRPAAIAQGYGIQNRCRGDRTGRRNRGSSANHRQPRLAYAAGVVFPGTFLR